MRTRAQIEAAEDEFFDRRWYAVDRETTIHAIAEQGPLSAEAMADGPKHAEVEKKYGRESLWPLTDYERGMLDGKHSALRWVLGDEWDMLDT